MKNEHRRGLLISIGILVIIFIIGTVPVLLGKSGSVTVNLDKANSLFGILGAYGDTVFIKLEDIDEIYLADNLDFGTMVEGKELRNIMSGIYSNDEFGTYQLHVYYKKAPFIVMKYGDGKVIVFNQSSEKYTKQVFEQLTE